MKVVSLFSGGGAMEVGAKNAGMEHILFVELNDSCRQVIAREWPGVPIHDDIRTLQSLPAGTEVVTCGFPCKNVSQLGDKAGIDGSHTGLVKEAIRLLLRAKLDGRSPEFVVFECVEGLLNSYKGEPPAIEWIIKALVDLKLCHSLAWRIVKAAAWGVPSTRGHTFLIACTHSDARDILLTEGMFECLGACGKTCYDCWGASMDVNVNGELLTQDGVSTVHNSKDARQGVTYDIIPRLTTGNGNRLCVSLTDGKVGYLKVEDGERLAGLPVGYTAPPSTPRGQAAAWGTTERWKMIGNAVPTYMAEWLFTCIMKRGIERCIIPVKLDGSTPSGDSKQSSKSQASVKGVESLEAVPMQLSEPLGSGRSEGIHWALSSESGLTVKERVLLYKELRLKGSNRNSPAVDVNVDAVDMDELPLDLWVELQSNSETEAPVAGSKALHTSTSKTVKKASGRKPKACTVTAAAGRLRDKLSGSTSKPVATKGEKKHNTAASGFKQQPCTPIPEDMYDEGNGSNEDSDDDQQESKVKDTPFSKCGYYIRSQGDLMEVRGASVYPVRLPLKPANNYITEVDEPDTDIEAAWACRQLDYGFKQKDDDGSAADMVYATMRPVARQLNIHPQLQGLICKEPQKCFVCSMRERKTLGHTYWCPNPHPKYPGTYMPGIQVAPETVPDAVRLAAYTQVQSSEAPAAAVESSKPETSDVWIRLLPSSQQQYMLYHRGQLYDFHNDLNLKKNMIGALKRSLDGAGQQELNRVAEAIKEAQHARDVKSYIDNGGQFLDSNEDIKKAVLKKIPQLSTIPENYKCGECESCRQGTRQPYRKCLTFKMAAAGINRLGGQLGLLKEKSIGARISLLWGEDNTYYRGYVIGYNPIDACHTVAYDDGDTHHLPLWYEQFVLVHTLPDVWQQLRPHIIQWAQEEADKDKKNKKRGRSHSNNGVRPNIVTDPVTHTVACRKRLRQLCPQLLKDGTSTAKVPAHISYVTRAQVPATSQVPVARPAVSGVSLYERETREPFSKKQKLSDDEVEQPLQQMAVTVEPPSAIHGNCANGSPPSAEPTRSS